jgi:hypothetical protein
LEVTTMSKRTIGIWWTAGTIAALAGTAGALLVAFATNPGNALHGHTGTAVALLLASFLVLGGGGVALLVAWVGALVNTHLLADKTWFNRLLWLGIMGLVFSPIVVGGLLSWGLMLAYLRSGPDGKAVQPPVATPTTLAPVS